MIWRHFVLSALSLPLLVGLASCDGPDFPEYKYKLTVEVDTPEGVKTGSSVMAVKTYNMTAAASGSRYLRSNARGEAVTIDLGQRGVMFALLRSEVSEDWRHGLLLSYVPEPPYEIAKAAEKKGEKDPRPEMRMAMLYKLRGKNIISRHDGIFYKSRRIKESDTPTNYPILVTFGDMADPKSVKKVDPDNLAATFGKGVKLKWITVEPTNDPVTVGIDKRFRWLGKYPEPRLENIPKPTATITFAQSISHGDFIRRE